MANRMGWKSWACLRCTPMSLSSAPRGMSTCTHEIVGGEVETHRSRGPSRGIIRLHIAVGYTPHGERESDLPNLVKSNSASLHPRGIPLTGGSV